MEPLGIFQRGDARQPGALVRYSIGIGLVGAAYLARLSLDPFLGQEPHPYATFYVAVAIAEFACGLGPAIMVLVFGFVASLWFIVPPRDALVVRGFADAMEILLYFLVSGTILLLMERLQKARSDLAANARALLETEQRFRSLAENLQDAIWLTSPDLKRCLYVNPAYSHIWNRSAEALSKDAFDWLNGIHCEDQPRIRQVFENRWVTEPIELEYRIQRPDGSVRWIRARSFPVRTDATRMVCAGHIAEDITLRKLMERARAKTREELERLVQERTARLSETVGELEHFSYALTHDMRAPLRAMRSYAEILKELWPASPPEGHEYCRRIITAAERMDLLICDSLNYAKIVREELPSHAVDLGKLVRGLIDTYPDLDLYKNHIEVVGELPGVMGHEAGLTQCLANLLSNAVKFRVPGRTPQIRIEAEKHEKMVRIIVTDNGMGIPKAAQHRLFGMFQRLTNQYEGTGIGLAIVRKVAERMGGSVGMVSEPGQGSRFWLELRPAPKMEQCLVRPDKEQTVSTSCSLSYPST
ncbi:MAG TPA: ATP-binding protein [Candidatus Limnocylindrales bacterium]|nr:ATP-binding protein [Candidatus Limnocylindrales bacterium]